MRILRRRWLVVALCITSLCGCSRKEAAQQSASNAKPRRPEQRTNVSNTALKKRSDEQKSATSTPEENAQPANDSLGAFQLFSPPKIEVPVIKQRDDRNKDDEPVRLIGFLKVDAPQALLTFDGKIRGMEVGETYKDVEVVAIDPPEVTLQRGNNRWKTTLFDQPIINKESSRSSVSRGGPRVTIGQGQNASSAGNWPASNLGNRGPVQNPTANEGATQGSAPSIPALPDNVPDVGQIPILPIPQIPSAPQ